MKLNKNYWKKGTAGNIGFAICGIEGSCVESFVIFSRKKKFPLPFFCNLVSGKLFLLSAVLVEIFGVKARTSQSRFPLYDSVSRELTKSNLFIGIKFVS